jgi:hypothetical protein
MKTEGIIAEIGRLEHLYSLPDTRSLVASDLRTANQRQTRCTRTIRGSGCGNDTASNFVYI